MVLEKSDYKITEKKPIEIEKEKLRYDIVEKDLELKYEKRSQNWLYKILKYNPFDWLNNIYRKFIDIHHMEDVECQLQWWAAYIYVKDVLKVIMFFIENRDINGIFNVVTGKARTWNDLSDSLFSAMS